MSSPRASPKAAPAPRRTSNFGLGALTTNANALFHNIEATATNAVHATTDMASSTLQNAAHLTHLDDVGNAIESNLHLKDNLKAVGNRIGEAGEALEDVAFNANNLMDDVTDKVGDVTSAVTGAADKLDDAFHAGFGAFAAKIGLDTTAVFGKHETTAEKKARLIKEKEEVEAENEKKEGMMSGKAGSRRSLLFSDANADDSAVEAKADMFVNGDAPFWPTTTNQLGTMGIGIQLYFEISKILAISFMVMFCCHIPTIYINSYGNDGHALMKDDKNAFSSWTLANSGFTGESVEEWECSDYVPLFDDGSNSSAGSVDCKGLSVDIAGTRYDSESIAMIITMCEMLASITFVVTCGACVFIVEKMEAKVDDENAEPEDYAVYVRGLPANTTIENLIEHFSPKYRLDEATPYYPSKLTPVGLSIRRANKYFWYWLLFVSPFAAWIVGEITGDDEKAAIAGAYSGLLIVADIVWTVWSKKGQTPSRRASPTEEYDEDMVSFLKSEKKQKEERGKKKEEEKVRKERRQNHRKNHGKNAKIADVEENAKEEDAKDDEEEGEEKEYDKATDLLRPNPQPVSDVSNTGNPVYKGTWIAEISLVHPTGGVIETFKSKESAIKRMKVREAKLKKRGESAKNKKKLESAQVEMERKQKKLASSIDPESAKDVIAAFVVFNCEESKNRCVEDYEDTGNWFYRLFQPSAMCFLKDGVSYKLRVEPAPTPSLVYWENLQISDMERLVRVAFTTFVTTVLLLISFAMIYAMAQATTYAKSMLPESGLCEIDLPTLHYGGRGFPDNATLVHDKTEDGMCGDGSFSVSYRDGRNIYDDPIDIDMTAYDEFTKIITEISVTRDQIEALEDEDYDYEFCDGSCVNKTSTQANCGGLGCQIRKYEHAMYAGTNSTIIESREFECDAGDAFAKADVIGCFCTAELARLTAANDIDPLGKLRDPEFEGEICADFADNYMNSQILGVLGAVIITAINIILKAVIQLLVKVERHASASTHSRNLVLKITAAQFLNTAMIGLLMNAQLAPRHREFIRYEGTPMEKYGILDGDYQDFRKGWFTTVGVALTMTMISNVVVPHVSVYAKGWIVRPLKIRFLGPRAVTKVEMDAVYSMDRFEIETRYAALLTYLIVSVLYAGAMPLMFLLASFNFGLSFIMDKYAILRITSQPLKYDSALARMMVRVFIPLAVILHLAFTVYIYSTPALMIDKETLEEYDGYDLRARQDEYTHAEMKDVILVSPPVNDFFRQIIEKMNGAHWLLDHILPRVLRANTFPLVIMMGGFITLYTLFSVFGEVIMAAIKLFVFEIALKAAEAGKKIADQAAEKAKIAAEMAMDKAQQAADKAAEGAKAVADKAAEGAKAVADKAADAGKGLTGVDARDVAGGVAGKANIAGNASLFMNAGNNMGGMALGGMAGLKNIVAGKSVDMPKMSLAAMKAKAQPDFTSVYEAIMTAEQFKSWKKEGRLAPSERIQGFRGGDDLKARCIWVEDTVTDDGVLHEKGEFKKTWEVMRMNGIHNYNVEENKLYDLAVSFMIEQKIHIENEFRNIQGSRQARMRVVAKALLKFKGFGSKGKKTGVAGLGGLAALAKQGEGGGVVTVPVASGEHLPESPVPESPSAKKARAEHEAEVMAKPLSMMLNVDETTH